MNDFQSVRAALYLARRLARQHRRIGLHRLLSEALEAFDHIEGRQAEQLPLAPGPQDLNRRAYALRMGAVELNRQAFALEEQATAWRRAGWEGQPAAVVEGDGC